MKKSYTAFSCLLFLVPSAFAEPQDWTAVIGSFDIATSRAGETGSCSMSRSDGDDFAITLVPAGGLLRQLATPERKLERGRAHFGHLTACGHSQSQDAERKRGSRMEDITARVALRQFCAISRPIVDGAKCSAAYK